MYLFDHIHMDPHLRETIFHRVLAISRVATLILGTVPLFATLWVARGPTEEIGRTGCLFVWRLYGGAGSLYHLLQWRHAQFLADILSGFIAIPVFLPLFGVAAFAVTFTWPINLTLGILLLLLLAARTFGGEEPDKAISQKHYQLACKAFSSAFLPVAFGMCGVFWMQLLFNVYDADSRTVRAYENRLGYLSARSKEWVDFSTPATVALAIGLIVLASLVPRLKPATRFLSFKALLEKVSAVVVCASSFTFFAQAPSKFVDWQESKRVQAQKRPAEKVSREAALQATYLIVKNLNQQDVVYYQRMFEQLNDTVPYADHARVVEALVAKRMSDTTSSKVPGPSKLEGTKEAQTLAQSGRMEQSLAVIKDLFCKSIGAISPEIGGLAGTFIEKLVDKEAERFFDRGIKPAIEKEVALAAQAEAKLRLKALSNKENAADDTESAQEEMMEIRTEIREETEKIREESYRREMEYRAEHPVKEAP
jgi:hypothetical protein